MSASQVKKVKFAQAVYGGAEQKAAAIAAGYKDGKGIEAQASKLMKDPIVLQELEKLRQNAELGAIVERKEVLELLSAHVRGNIGQLVRGGRLSVSRARKFGHLVKSISVSDGEKSNSVRIELHDPHAAIDRIARMLGWYAPEKHQHEHRLQGVASMSMSQLVAEFNALQPCISRGSGGGGFSDPQVSIVNVKK